MIFVNTQYFHKSSLWMEYIRTALALQPIYYDDMYGSYTGSQYNLLFCISQHLTADRYGCDTSLTPMYGDPLTVP